VRQRTVLEDFLAVDLQVDPPAAHAQDDVVVSPDGRLGLDLRAVVVAQRGLAGAQPEQDVVPPRAARLADGRADVPLLPVGRVRAGAEGEPMSTSSGIPI